MPCPSPTPRPPAYRAFTLIEFLLVAAILTVGVGLLLPAIQKTREAAARARCSNNLREIGQAFHGYYQANAHFPLGGNDRCQWKLGCGANAGLTTPEAREAEWSWAYQILPHLGKESLYRNPDSAAVMATPVRRYYCPSRRSPLVIEGVAKIGYAGSAGDHLEGQTGMVMRSARGVVQRDDVTDGLSNTAMVAEKRLNEAMFGRTHDDNESYCTAGWNGDWELYRWGAEPPAPDFDLDGSADPSRVFGSAHPTGFNCVFGDGTVRFIPYSVNPATWRRACVRNDKEEDVLNDP